MIRPSLSRSALAVVLTLPAAALAQDRNPFLDLCDAMTGPDSLFNGPDRNGPDTLHGEGDGHWFPGYLGLIRAPANARTNWPAVLVPKWQNNNGPKASVQPFAPVLPLDRGVEDGLRIVEGAFLTGAIMWPHEEYVEQYVDGTLPALGSEHKVPIYWVVGYRLYIPSDYGRPRTDTLHDTRGKALIVQAGGGAENFNLAHPPWMIDVLTSAQWRDKAARDAALRLGVPVLYLGPDPVAKNAFAPNSRNLPQGGVGGYWGEALADFADHWSIRAPEADPLRDHPQFMYIATYVRARTFLESFFNPVSNGTASWSLWDDITGGDASRYTPMHDVIVMAGSKRGYAARLAAIADPYITGVMANGAGCPSLVLNARLNLDEQWEDRDADYLGGKAFNDEMKAPPIGDPNQFPPVPGMQRAVEVISQVHSGLAERQLQYYDYFRAFRDRDVMQDASHPDNPQPEVWVLNAQGMQDNFWPLQNWTYWVENKVFTGSHEYFYFQPRTLHPPYYAQFADEMHGFCEAKWFSRPMPRISITGIDYPMPIDGQAPDTIPLTIRAQAVVPGSAQWPLDGPPNFDLCMAVRPASATMSRGMWSDAPRGNAQKVRYGRQTPWWVIPATDVQRSGDVYTITFSAVSHDYASVTPAAPYFPEGFQAAFPNGLDLTGIPPEFHVALFVRVSATHIRPGADRWPVTNSSVIEFLPPWTRSPGKPRPGSEGDDIITFEEPE